MTTLQHSKIRGGLVWNLVQWIQQRQRAKREGNTFATAYAQEWIDDCRARIKRLNELEQGGAR
jgi:hypothetical protein